MIHFNTCSSHYHRGGSSKGYKGDADFFGVFCPQNGKVYLVPVSEMPTSKGYLRVDKAKNNQKVTKKHKPVTMAADYEIAAIAQTVEHFLGKEKVTSSILVGGSK